ncbi:hypothetical protein SDRG_03393 [Saprolegnia diclina VS20]|uniref:Acyl-coenzyme A oxidase n=1 Tax=Saprolegnia diclina (strain VS20) TaxID=1156394 RepID=T0S933_SAPDV|nr:hypothetical protein SDRG_03393 [Saprolegnia diclina VS20]EQC39187.1 hypothetical protein SDRG_03393 [Saprolegnia diclina VS20]|eukprot:XP_008607248.1 hypothetical protein SDRG_03393 [Saprolegnia diclina VS20]
MNPQVLAQAIGVADARREAWLAAIAYPGRVYGRSHEEEYVASLEKTATLLSFFQTHGIVDVDDQEALSEALGCVLPLDMHRKMFVPALQLSMSAAQWALWQERSRLLPILGAYAQTELGHGSNIRALETTATYDPATEIFDLHSPTLTSRKWWPGGLGKTTNFAVVYARLLGGDGTDHGVHAFLVQLRDLASHASLPGVHLGDIGAKIGFNGVDNGFCSFEHVAVPKAHLLLGTARVEWSPQGQLRRRAGTVAPWGYFTMVKTRVFLVSKCARFLGRALALTLANLQSRGVDARRTLYPAMGLALASIFAGQSLYALYTQVLAARDTRELHTLHATSSGLKALVSARVVDSLQACIMTGGNDASHAVVYLKNEIVGACTYEGTFDVLVLQHGAYLRKQPRIEPPRLAHMELTAVPDLLMLFSQRLHALQSDTVSKGSAYRTTRLSLAASELYLLEAFADRLRTVKDAATTDALSQLWCLLSYAWVLQSLHEFRPWLSSSDGESVGQLFEATAMAIDDATMASIVAAWGFGETELSRLDAEFSKL